MTILEQAAANDVVSSGHSRDNSNSSTDDSVTPSTHKRQTPKSPLAIQNDLEGRIKNQCIGIDGRWYDVSKFVDHHPGGDIITHFIGWLFGERT